MDTRPGCKGGVRPHTFNALTRGPAHQMRSPWRRDGGRGAGGGGGAGEERVGRGGWDGDEMSEGRNEREGCGVMNKMGRGRDDILPSPAD